jgi:hypothetical protein
MLLATKARSFWNEAKDRIWTTDWRPQGRSTHHGKGRYRLRVLADVFEDEEGLKMSFYGVSWQELKVTT